MRRWCPRCAAACGRKSAASWKSCVVAVTVPPCWAQSCRSTPRRPPTSPASCTPHARDCRHRARAPAPQLNPDPAGARNGLAALLLRRPPPRAPPAGTGLPGTAQPAPWTTPILCLTPRSSSTPGGPRGPAAAARASRRPRSPRTKPTHRPRPVRPVRPGPRSRRGAGGAAGEWEWPARLRMQPGPCRQGLGGPRERVPPPGSGPRWPRLLHPFQPLPAFCISQRFRSFELSPHAKELLCGAPRVHLLGRGLALLIVN